MSGGIVGVGSFVVSGSGSGSGVVDMVLVL